MPEISQVGFWLRGYKGVSDSRLSYKATSSSHSPGNLCQTQEVGHTGHSSPSRSQNQEMLLLPMKAIYK